MERPSKLSFRSTPSTSSLFSMIVGRPARGSTCSALRDSQKRFGPFAVFLGAGLGAASPSLGEALFGVGQLFFELCLVELVGGDRLLDKELGVVAEDLQPAVGLGVADRLGVAYVQA